MSEDQPVDIHAEMHLEIKHRKLWAIQISPENFSRIANMFRDHAIRYDIPHPSEGREASLTMSVSVIQTVRGGLLDYLVWGPGEKLHVVPANEFKKLYNVVEEIV